MLNRVIRRRWFMFSAIGLAIGGMMASASLGVTSPSVAATPRVSAGFFQPPSGKRMATNDLSSGECAPSNTFSQPPAGFDPTTATDTQLAEYGFPQRPVGDASSPAVQLWRLAIAHAKAYVAPSPVCTTATFYLQTSGNWAGYVASHAYYNNVHFTWAESAWVVRGVPADDNSTCYSWPCAPGAAFWTGTGLNDIIQGGHGLRIYGSYSSVHFLD